MAEFKTTHKLDFEAGQGKYGMQYRVGTCTGQWGTTKDCYYILSVLNHEPGNGHLDDVFEWFEHSCKSHGKNLLVLECMNESFHKHLTSKRGFVALNKDNLIKVFNKTSFKKLLKRGNEMIEPKTYKCKCATLH